MALECSCEVGKGGRVGADDVYAGGEGGGGGRAGDGCEGELARGEEDASELGAKVASGLSGVSGCPLYSRKRVLSVPLRVLVRHVQGRSGDEGELTPMMATFLIGAMISNT